MNDLYEVALKKVQSLLKDRESVHIILKPFNFNLTRHVQIYSIFLNTEFQTSKINLASIALCSALDDRHSAGKIFGV